MLDGGDLVLELQFAFFHPPQEQFIVWRRGLKPLDGFVKIAVLDPQLLELRAQCFGFVIGSCMARLW
jgi:hypothetical protein